MSLCPHKFGWDYNTSRDRRWCLLCAQGQRLLIVLNTGTAIWIRAESAGEIERPPLPEPSRGPTSASASKQVRSAAAQQLQPAEAGSPRHAGHGRERPYRPYLLMGDAHGAR